MASGHRLGLRVAAGVLAACAGAWAVVPAEAGPVLDRVKARGGASTGTTGGAFHSIDSAGRRHGFVIDMCRAIAIALFGDPAKGVVQGMQYVQSFTAIRTGEVDVITWTNTYTAATPSTCCPG